MPTTFSDYSPSAFPPAAQPMHFGNYLEHFAIPRMGKLTHLPVSRVVWIGTQYRMVYAFTDLQRHLLNFGLDELAERLNPVEFFRIHRSTIVNLRKIAKVSNLSDGRCKLIMQDKAGSEIMVSRYRSMEFKKAFTGCAHLREETAFDC